MEYNSRNYINDYRNKIMKLFEEYFSYIEETIFDSIREHDSQKQ